MKAECEVRIQKGEREVESNGSATTLPHATRSLKRFKFKLCVRIFHPVVVVPSCCCCFFLLLFVVVVLYCVVAVVVHSNKSAK